MGALAPTRARHIIHSDGGGTQSVAIVTLVANGVLPAPDLNVFCQTPYMDPATMAYRKKWVLPLLKALSIPCLHLLPDPEGAHVFDAAYMPLPAYARGAKLKTFCNSAWLRQPIADALRGIGYGPRNPTVVWLGMTTDEPKRLRLPKLQHRIHAYPLITLGMSRPNAIQAVKNFGLPRPPRSACTICPNKTNPEWRELRARNPAAFERACQVDDDLRTRRPGDPVYLHRTLVPLRHADLSTPPSHHKKSPPPPITLPRA